MKTFNIFIIFLYLLLTPCLNAQNILSEAVPVDPEIIHGTLDNGMTYYIRANNEPEKRASFYIIQNVGALLETDQQNGLAHFLEHMAFNGTEHFHGKGIINSLEKHGVAFGYNINAYTSYNETVYNLSDVPVDHPGLLDTCLLILNDWSNFLLLTEEEIDAERPVIIEEWRTRRTAGFRMMKKYMPFLLQGSKYHERDVIGDLEIIKSFDYKTLRDFYHTWYRTELQAIAIVGDFDAREMEQKVTDLFSKIPPVTNPPARPFFEVPEHDETLYVHVTDKEASQNSVDMYIKIKAVNPDVKGMNYLKEQYIRTLFNSMMSTRINELLQKGIPPFITGTVRYGGFVRGYDIFSIAAMFKKDEDALAFESIYTEAERVRRYGFTGGELERAKSNMLTSWDNYYKQRDKIDNDTYASNIQSHFLINEPLASIEFEYSVIKNLLPEISLEEVSAKAGEWMTKKNRVIIVQGPESEDAGYLTEEEATEIIERVSTADIDPYEDKVAGESLITEDLQGSKVVSVKQLEQFGAVEWRLENGVKVIFRKADFEKDNIALSGYSFGGTSLVKTEFVPEADMLSTLVSAYGTGDFDNITLQKMLTGKKATLNLSLSEVTENINGSSTLKDFETMLQLLWLKFEKPRFDEEAHNALMSRYSAFLAQMNNNPQKVMQDSVTLIFSNYHSRVRVMNNSYLRDIEFNEIERIYRERFKGADDFIFFIVGNMEEDEVKPLVEKYIGSLTRAEGEENWKNHKKYGPKGKTVKEIGMELEIPKSTVIVNFSKKFEFNAYNRQAFRVIKGILDLRYNETIREEEGGTYGVSTNITTSQYPEEKVNAVILFDCEPERANNLKEIVYGEIEKLYTSGPGQEDLDKAILNIIKNREESKQHNSYWLSTLYSYYFSGIDYNDPANYEDIVKGFTIEDIMIVAGKFFKEADVIDLVFKPAE
ncbi:MAG: insulinase family protein [Bacteroidales bacterium]|nr:insulinase family protein [Bacteroidales bacterium]